MQGNNDVSSIRPNAPMTRVDHASPVGMHALSNPNGEKVWCDLGLHNKAVHSSILGPPPGFKVNKLRAYYSKLATFNPLSTTPIYPRGGWPQKPLPVISCFAKHSFPHTLSNFSPSSLSSLHSITSTVFHQKKRWLT